MVPRYEQFLLPFAEKEYVDVRRAAHILGVCGETIYNLWEAGAIEIIDYKKRKRKRVRYASIVAFCDRLRRDYHIKDRRPELASAILRHRDADLLPFPLTDTMSADDAARVLGYDSKKCVYDLIDEGAFEAYKISTISPWRISRSSLAAFLEQVHANAVRSPRADSKLSATSPSIIA